MDRPRLIYRLEKIVGQGQRILLMPRENWNAIQSEYGMPIEISVKETPMSNITKDATLVATVAIRYEDRPPVINI